MKLATVVVALAAMISPALAGTCPKTPRLVFDPPGDRHSLPQLTWNGSRYQLVGYDGPPTHLVLTTFDLAKAKPASVVLGDGGLSQTATNGKQLGVGYIANGAIVPRTPKDKIVKKGTLEYLVVDGREVHSPQEGARNQSFFMILDAAGKPVVKPIALGDQRVMHTSPGVAVAWNARDSEWGVVWSEFNKLVFGRISKTGTLLGTTPIVVDGYIHASSHMLWTGSAYAFLANTPKGLALYEVTAAGAKATPLALESTAIEPVLAYNAGTYAIAYRFTRPGTQAATPKKVPRQIATDKDPAPSRPQPGPAPISPPQNQVVFHDGHDLVFVTVTGGKLGPKATLVALNGGPSIDTPVIQADGDQYVIVWGEHTSVEPSFDDRFKVARVDGKGAIAAGYPKRLDDEEINQGYASIAGTGCDLAVSYILGDPNGSVRVGVVRAP